MSLLHYDSHLKNNMNKSSTNYIKNNQDSKARDLFLTLCREFPDLDISLTHSELSSHLRINEESGICHSIDIDLLDKSSNYIYDTIFTLKEICRKFDA